MYHMPSVLWRCWLGGRKGIRPVKNWAVGCWHGYLFGARCRLACGPADAIGPLPLAVSCFSKIQIGFTFLVPAHPGSPGKRAIKRVCVCVYISHACTPCWYHFPVNVGQSFALITAVTSLLVPSTPVSFLSKPTRWFDDAHFSYFLYVKPL